MRDRKTNRMSHRINHIHIRKSFWQKLWENRRQWRVWVQKKIYSGSMKKVEWWRTKWCRNRQATFFGSPEILSLNLHGANGDFNFSPEPPIAVVRCPSMNKLLGSELSTSCGSLGTRRPRSCNASTESLPTFLPSTLSIEALYCCPSGDQCFEEKLNKTSLIQHINEVHQLPVISFGSSSAEIPLPPRAPLENASLILLLDEKQFWVKVAADE